MDFKGAVKGLLVETDVATVRAHEELAIRPSALLTARNFKPSTLPHRKWRVDTSGGRGQKDLHRTDPMHLYGATGIDDFDIAFPLPLNIPVRRLTAAFEFSVEPTHRNLSRRGLHSPVSRAAR